MKIYDLFDKKTENLKAHAIMKDSDYIARVVFHSSASGVVTCFFQVWGAAMVAGKASGYGYDKITAALDSALDSDELEKTELSELLKEKPEGKNFIHFLNEKGYNVVTVF